MPAAARIQTDASAAGAPSRTDVRFIGDVMGSYVLASRLQAQGSVQVFACRARSISAYEAVIHAPVTGTPGEALTVTFQGLGILHGRIGRVVDGGFVASFECTEPERALLASRIDWLKRRTLKAVADRRAHKRVLPRETRAKLLLGDGTSYDCFIIDMSQSGVAVSADVLPPLGALAGVGAVPGKVVRYVEAGFAVQFAELQQLEQLEALLTGQTEQNRHPAARQPGVAGEA
ncbi:MAG: PilZ domain-containing protein [Devosia sp.]|uniref:PilZ domain-containing protein n=1 Tax=Devosia sp. TaxID=1871048 RepID=UPI001ACE2B4C|nr:PilZ domain-containing protein [Devosia sp.]MBN9314387.1 PilZ domain-containing protein [Devosia sp.]